MKVYRVYVGTGYIDAYEKNVGFFLNRDDAQKCVNLCRQRIDNGRLQFDYACVDAYEIEDLETVMKRLEEEICKNEDESRWMI